MPKTKSKAAPTVETPQAPPAAITDPDTLPILMTTRELSAFTKVQEQTLESWRPRGEGPVYTRLGRSIRYHRADVLAWLVQRRVVAHDPTKVLS
ncbi:helix-turn-helix domain-containing protein [Roseomonas sp. PWR1]|uniref:Helix-turn-helix domain-containing protein n=1 Tax=Roseomonas nitratireducens TaxID=2820810 RepID=A0ABS4AX95_9PROT|nr:helix-turn-helix domain-containing protein [Neoroseomonas nitratireducens]MBP0465869.1 helix-turn-helix domain-containing protein [Neoroseomonas nitratireducens]